MRCALLQGLSLAFSPSRRHFSRQWIHSSIGAHADMCGRDGDVGQFHGGWNVGKLDRQGTWTSAGTGTGYYTYKAQCIFFSSPNEDCWYADPAWSRNPRDAHPYC